MKNNILSKKSVYNYIFKNYGFIFIMLSILFQATGGVFGKYASNTIDNLTIPEIMSNTFYILSIICMILQAIVWQQALRYYQLSFAYPFMSLVNFVILLYAYILFDESITITNIIGLLIISSGVYFLSRDDKKI